jgi:septal ring factor EnvC (AmiA/AmiB activator)
VLLLRVYTGPTDLFSNSHNCRNSTCPTLGSLWTLDQHEPYCSSLHCEISRLSSGFEQSEEQLTQYAEEIEAERDTVGSLTQQLNAERQTVAKLRKELAGLNKAVKNAKQQASLQIGQGEQSSAEHLPSQDERERLRG